MIRDLFRALSVWLDSKIEGRSGPTNSANDPPGFATDYDDPNWADARARAGTTTHNNDQNNTGWGR